MVSDCMYGWEKFWGKGEPFFFPLYMLILFDAKPPNSMAIKWRGRSHYSPAYTQHQNPGGMGPCLTADPFVCSYHLTWFNFKIWHSNPTWEGKVIALSSNVAGPLSRVNTKITVFNRRVAGWLSCRPTNNKALKAYSC